VRFVDDYRVILQEIPVTFRFGEEDAVGHKLYDGVRRFFGREAYFVPDLPPKHAPELRRDARGDGRGRNAPRLRAPYPPSPPAPGVQAKKRQLRSLAGTGLPGHNDYLVASKRVYDFIALFVDRKIARRPVDLIHKDNIIYGAPRLVFLPSKLYFSSMINKLTQLNNFVLAYITAKDKAQALSIGRTLVEERLAACANVIDGMTSVYHWEGEICEDSEAILIAKTAAEKIEALTERVKQLHTYSCPCVVAIPLADGTGNKEYLDWLRNNIFKT
jgi:periplasmic divalent cation tolerance protein